MPKNTAKDLNNHLFEALERLNDDELMENNKKADQELKRAQQIANIGKTIVANYNAIIKAQKIINESGVRPGENILAIASKEKD